MKSKGITAVLEDDISMVMYRRALQGYSLNLNKVRDDSPSSWQSSSAQGFGQPLDNMIIQQMHQPSDVEVDPLTEVWDWIHRACGLSGMDFSSAYGSL